ncbi:MAG: chromosomal replication initiator protein DnaA [Ignavibacteriae bacterium]|nr:chromosomal replication initiator protein DnaA [Ignavibacteriota bacterium]MCB9216738.1 chromosomal replication initiator protein DnaA [Ignavibacteria bacterium]
MPEQVSREVEVVWNECLDLIKEKVSPQAFKTWFEPTKPLSLDDATINIQVPNRFFYEWIDEKYYSVVRKTLVKILGESAKLVYHTVDEEVQEDPETRSVKFPFPNTQVPEVSTPGPSRTIGGGAQGPQITFTRPPVQITSDYSSVELNPRFTFENFVMGECNQFAHAAAKAVAENPGKTRFNPMVLYGGTGLGKTHLAQAIGHEILQRGTGERIIYTTSERFSLDFVDSIQNQKTTEFNNFYRSATVLIVDDIQFFANKEATQDNFFHTFNALNQAGKQIILTSDVPPKQLQKVNERLISRFQWGLTTDLQPPDLETRIAILQKMSADEGYQLPGDVIEYIARNITHSVRELEGCLISLLAESSLRSIPLSVDLTRDVIGDIATVQEQTVTAERIQQEVCELLQIPLSLLTGKSRKQEIVFARQVAMYLIRELTSASLKTIGNHFGGRDHTTVMHSLNTITDLVQAGDDRTRRALNGLYRTLGVSAR